MRRRDFIKVIGSGAVVCPIAARAQQPERIRRVGVLISFAKDTPEGLARIAAFVKELQQLG
jgi:putative ABC transport system substrate-binding protein